MQILLCSRRDDPAENASFARGSGAAVSGRERRIYPRLSPRELSSPASIRIPNRPPVSLVDLSPGGALLDMPFQMRPNARLTLEFRAESERMLLPFRMLRCYVTSLRGGVQYQAAGEFEHPLDWKPLLAESEAQATATRLIATLEAFLRQGPATGRMVEFDHLLMWVLDAAKRSESSDRISVEIQRRLTRLIPSIAVEPSTKPSLPDPARGARFFGFDFSCERSLTAPDRRLLRTAAQLLSIVNTSREASMPRARPLNFRPRQEPAVIAYSIADWQEMRDADAGPQIDPRLKYA